LIEEWKSQCAAGSDGADGTTGTNTTSSTWNQQQEGHDDQDDDELTLQYFIPAPPALICQYFKERLISPNLPEALSSVILRRESVAFQNDDPSFVALAESVEEEEETEEQWWFRTAAPAFPMSWYGSTVLGIFGVEASAIECWQIQRVRKNDNDNKSDVDFISKATCTIENETARSVLVFREKIVMEASYSENGDTVTGTKVTKTLNLDGVPSLGHGAFQRRWKKESELIFHALLGTCDRKKMKRSTDK